MKSTPITIITGFLGSGKTTIIQNTVEKIWDKEKIAIIKNEISDVGVDSLELSNSKLEIIELPNGCVCCTLVGSLNDTLKEILEKYHPDRIFIEASGFAKPGQIVIGLELVPNITIDGVIVVLDALNYTQLKEIEKSNAAKVQSEFIDLYIINKVDQVLEEQIDLIKDDILGNDSTARIIETKNADIPPQLIIGIHDNFIESEIELDHDHSYEDFNAFNIENLKITDLEILKQKFESLPKNIYRVKGYFVLKDKNHILNGVAGKIDIKEINVKIPQESKFVFIGKDIEKYKGSIENLNV